MTIVYDSYVVFLLLPLSTLIIVVIIIYRITIICKAYRCRSSIHNQTYVRQYYTHLAS